MNSTALHSVAQAIDKVMRADRGRLMSGLVARLEDFHIAEESLQEALIQAHQTWLKTGIPENPTAWLMKVAFRKGIDQIRTNVREAQKQSAPEEPTLPPKDFPDERLKLIFTCCHPALDSKSRIALTLRVICGLTTKEIASAFLDEDKTIGQRLTRAKAKIAQKSIPFRVPEAWQWGERLESVLSTIYLIFTTGYKLTDPDARDLCEEAIFLTRLLNTLAPDQAEVEGALALFLFTNARIQARVAQSGESLPLQDQNHEKWDHAQIEEAQAHLASALQRGQSGAFQIKAAIADCHMQAPKPDWAQMALLYQSLWTFEPSPVVALNWAVVVCELGEVDLALRNLNALKSQLQNYQPWHAARADMQARLGHIEQARKSYQRASDMTNIKSEKCFLQKRMQNL